jgi:hypothetical protein
MLKIRDETELKVSISTLIQNSNSLFNSFNLSLQILWSSICIQLLLFHNNQKNVYPHSFLFILEFLELSYRNSIKRSQEELWIFLPKTPTLYQWTTNPLNFTLKNSLLVGSSTKKRLWCREQKFHYRVQAKGYTLMIPL